MLRSFFRWSTRRIRRSEANVLPVSGLSPEAIDILSSPGKMLVATDTFYEALVDKSINRFLNYNPDQLFGAAIELIPEIRLQLVEFFSPRTEISVRWSGNC